MFCKNCGKELNPTDKFCNNCGTLIETESVDNAPINELPKEEVPVEEPIVTETPVVEKPTVAPVEEPVAPVEPTVSAPASDIPEAPVAPVINAPITPAPKKSSNIGFIIIIIVLGLIIVGVGIFLGIKLLGGKKTDTPVVETPSTPTSEPTTPTTTDTSSKITINGFTFTVPTGCTKTTVEGLEAIDCGKYYFTNMDVYTTANYDYFKTNLTTMLPQSIASWTNLGFSYIESGETTVSGKKYLYIQYYHNQYGVYGDVVLTANPNGSVFKANLYYPDEDTATKGYNTISTFTSSCTDRTSNFSDTEENAEFNSGIQKADSIKFE